MADQTSSRSGSSNSQTTTTTSQGPATFGGGMFTGGDLVQQILGIVQQQNAGISLANQQRLENQAAADQLAGQAAVGQREAIQQRGEVAAAKADIEYQQNALLQEIQKSLNLDPTAEGNAIAKNIAVRDALQPELMAAQQEYTKAASTDLLSNPLGFIFAQLKLPSLEEKVRGLSTQIQIADQDTAERQARLGAARSTALANTADATRSAQLKAARVDAMIAEANVKSAEAATRSQAAQTAMQTAQIINMQGDNAKGAITTVVSLRDAEEQRKFRNEQRQLVAEQRAEIMQQKKEKQEETDRWNARFRIVSDSLGLQEPMTVDMLKKLGNPKMEEAWLKAAATGQFGEDLFDSIRFFRPQAVRLGLEQQGASGLYEASKKLETAGVQFKDEANRQHLAKNPTGKPLPEAQALAEGFRIYQDTVEKSALDRTAPVDLSSAKWDQQYNPYKAPFLTFSQLGTQDPKFARLKDNELKKAVDAIAASSNATGNLNADQTQQALAVIREKVRLRQLSPQQAAAQISDFMKAASQWNADQTGYSLFGLPQQGAYQFSLRGGDRADKVDLMNPVEVERTLMRQITSMKDPMGFSPIGGFR